MVTYEQLMTKTQTHCKAVDGEVCSFYNKDNEECMDWIESGIIPDCVNWDSIEGREGLYEFYTFHEII